MFDSPPADPPVNFDCPFCAISAAHEPYDPFHPPSSISPAITTPASFVALSTPDLIAFLDILPLSRGHLLLCPRAHRPKLTDSTASEARLLGYYVRILSAALARTTGTQDWNLVQNNGAAAAQVVPHMHYHIIPRPDIRARGKYKESFTMFGRGVREELDDDEAEAFVKELRKHVADVLREDDENDKNYKIRL